MRISRWRWNLASSKKNKQQKKYRVGKTAGRVLEYWLDSLDEGERSAINRLSLDDALELPRDLIQAGAATPHCVRTFHEERIKERSADAARPPAEEPVLICPLRYEKSDRGAPGPRFLQLLWVPAMLTPDARLLPPEKGLPWIPRDHLEPVVDDESIVIATVRAVERFAEKNDAGSFRTWAEYWAFVELFCKAATKERLDELPVEGYRRRAHGLIVCDPSGRSGNESLRRLLTQVQEGFRPAGVLAHLASLDERKHVPFSSTKRSIAAAAIKHCGHFGDNFALAPSQRRAVHRALETPENDFLTVTGPPGTGKTTLIQSVIASLWTDAARRNAERPPIIVVVGATNQAVLNVIDSLETAVSSLGPLAERWLPKVHSFGTFCSSKTRAKDSAGYQLELRSGAGISSEMEQESYLQIATRQFLERLESISGKRLTLRQAIPALRRLVAEEYTALFRIVSNLRDGPFLEWMKSLIGIKTGLTAEELFERLPELDTTHRHRAFIYAMHYWEARWLEAATAAVKALPPSERGRFRGAVADWGRRAMVTPAFVSTIAMLPRFFAASRKSVEPTIDLLIFDEAGQVPVEQGAACLALARRALVIGDCAQLEPLWSVSPHVDRRAAEAKRLVKPKDNKGWEELHSRGVLASSGSLMYLAMRSVKYVEQSRGHQTRGVFLREHRRSVPEIVEFSNTLCYGGRLEPHRPALESRPFPPFGYLNVHGTSIKSGHSRWSALEAERIEQWLAQNEQTIREFYGRPVEDTVAVITPFVAQLQKLRDRLQKRYPNMTIGTVNSLQGAEREIVIFSTVYDATFEGIYFFDRGTNMLNVAVSRAKDSFLVFGDMGIFRPDGDRPSSVLARFLFSDQDNELSLELPAKEIPKSERTTRIVTLDDHRAALAEAFSDAEQRIVISSPTISIHAVNADNIPRLIKTARGRGLEVIVYTDSALDNDNGKIKPNAEAGRAALVAAGADLRVAFNIHNKSLTVDERYIIDGSCNWLSAVRGKAAKYRKLETSTKFEGPSVTKHIGGLLDELDHRVKLQTAEEAGTRRVLRDEED